MTTLVVVEGTKLHRYVGRVRTHEFEFNPEGEDGMPVKQLIEEIRNDPLQFQLEGEEDEAFTQPSPPEGGDAPAAA